MWRTSLGDATLTSGAGAVHGARAPAGPELAIHACLSNCVEVKAPHVIYFAMIDADFVQIQAQQIVNKIWLRFCC